MEYESNNTISNYQLEKAVAKLNEFGQDVFDMYANEQDLSFCDRNRCIAKCRIAYNRDDMQEMACPDNLKHERWEHYTKTLRYSTKKAMKLLYAIDQSYDNQFIPKLDTKTLTSKAFD